MNIYIYIYIYIATKKISAIFTIHKMDRDENISTLKVGFIHVCTYQH